MPYLYESLDDFIKSLNEKQTDPELMAKMEDDLYDEASFCPRCGKDESECICQDRDFFSTVTVYRAANGKKKKKDDFKS